ncbi:YkvA family protein [Parachryseolinea silvisoli]|jgi:uncharacterized membrane protein YkvA (DUF1232 family)|uniref:YkvA family protein n=1 Tax=Parachryseolinea silvisoli TaxID=2873601 RepID=UPI0022659AA3|nr:DUF1232 domain-containing protein [Parachryseolinea silvisoli]MCD9019502.1 DUF1232 domain-containing protein [Parachryseolinea silvisoli]
MLKNRFFDLALTKASGILGTRGRLVLLLTKLGMKLKSVSWKDVNAAAAKEKLLVLGRISRAYATGQYREVPWKTMVMIVAALAYFVMPIDLLPDLMPITGLTDDVAVLVAVYNAVSVEVDKFLLWEKNRSLVA